MDLIRPAMVANIASPLATLSSPRLSSEPTTIPSSVDVNQAVEGLISLNSVAHTPSPVTPLPAPVLNISPTITRRSSTCCGIIASTVALTPPDKDEEDFFATCQRSSLKQSAPEQLCLKVKELTLERQQAKMAQSAKDRKELLKYMAFTRSKLVVRTIPPKPRHFSRPVTCMTSRSLTCYRM